MNLSATQQACLCRMREAGGEFVRSRAGWHPRGSGGINSHHTHTMNALCRMDLVAIGSTRNDKFSHVAWLTMAGEKAAQRLQ